MKTKKPKKPKLEFTKLILRSVMIVYISTVVYGYVYYILSGFMMSLDALFTFVGTPTVTAIGFYVWKAKAENLSKHSKEEQEHIKNEIKKSEVEEVTAYGYSADTDVGYSMSGGYPYSPCFADTEPEKEEYRVAEVCGVGSREAARGRDGSVKTKAGV